MGEHLTRALTFDGYECALDGIKMSRTNREVDKAILGVGLWKIFKSPLATNFLYDLHNIVKILIHQELTKKFLLLENISTF